MNQQNGFQFKNNNQNNAVGILMIVLGSVMGVSILGAGISTIRTSPLIGLLVILSGIACIGLFIWFGCQGIKKSQETDRRLKNAMARYSMAAIQQEISRFTVASYVNPFNLGTVYFTERFIISSSEGVFAYSEIASISAYKSTSKYGITDNYMRLKLHSGELVVICQNRGADPALRAQLIGFVNLCVQKNPAIQADVKELL
ncbi:MAG: hypothetical protein IJ512_02770 [Ruminococcus sp.]|nr:hypothetical protein [Ruminococcus sp.]